MDLCEILGVKHLPHLRHSRHGARAASIMPRLRRMAHCFTTIALPCSGGTAWCTCDSPHCKSTPPRSTMAAADGALATLSALADKWRDDLVSNVLPFWLKNSLDHEFGGYFTCLDRDGSVLAQDKYHW
jgi:hypothetical protein